jgi:hypothetical protein
MLINCGQIHTEGWYVTLLEKTSAFFDTVYAGGMKHSLKHATMKHTHAHMQSSWTHLIIQSRNFVEVRWRSPKYLPWQAMHFLQRSTHFSKTELRSF